MRRTRIGRRFNGFGGEGKTDLNFYFFLRMGTLSVISHMEGKQQNLI